MKAELLKKYRPYKPIHLPDRTWPDQTITKPPQWCSVDLRDGNQALIVPMNLSKKLKMFHLLLEIGYKQIEVGFPSAAKVEFDFLRKIIDDNLVPEDVTVQVLTQAREHLIRKTFDALKGLPQAIVHLYNSTSTLQREVVFGKDKAAIRQLAVDGVKLVKQLSKETDTKIILQYSPESFTGTEPDYAVEVCEAVMAEWDPASDEKVILNLPATVEMTMPNLYADQIEYFIRKLPNRKQAIVSLHAHNDRGTAVAATELGLLAGADRVEGTLFGNGERTGNVDIVTLALNMYSQGIDPLLDFHEIDKIIAISEECTGIPVHMRHPYAGELVYTAFSGSHQDAINKGMKQMANKTYWEVPYLPIDPSDLGRTYEAIIRINSQSGKGGVSYILEQDYGCSIPKDMQPVVAEVIQQAAEEAGDELPPEKIWKEFETHFINVNKPIELESFRSDSEDNGKVKATLTLKWDKKYAIEGEGNGPIDAARQALAALPLPEFKLIQYQEHALGEGSDSTAIAYIGIELEKDGIKHRSYGVGMDPNINKASVKALIAALNRSLN